MLIEDRQIPLSLKDEDKGKIWIGNRMMIKIKLYLTLKEKETILSFNNILL